MHQNFTALLESDQPPPALYIDGPYGSPTQDFDKYPVAFFAAAGIGATPMVSVLREVSRQSTLNNLAQASDQKDHSCWPHTVYFHWMVREQAAAQSWFNNILEEVLAADTLGQVHINVWFTGGGSREDMKTLVMQLSQDVAREKTGIEMISGLSSVSDQFTVHFGRPDWKAQFNELELRHENEVDKVGVFCCGPAVLEQDLYEVCVEKNVRSGSGLKFEVRAERF